MKPGGFATGAFRAAGAFAARLAYTPSVYWPLGAAFSLSLPRRTRAFGAGLLAACGLAAAACLAPPALGFTLAAVVGILILKDASLPIYRATSWPRGAGVEVGSLLRTG